MLSGFQWIAVVAVGGWTAIVLYRMHLVGSAASRDTGSAWR